MDLSTINHVAVFVATISAFVLGGIWYGPMFGKAWMKEIGTSEGELKKANQGKIYGLAFLWTMIMAYNLAMFLNDPSVTMGQAVMYSFFTGLRMDRDGDLRHRSFRAKVDETDAHQRRIYDGCPGHHGVILGAWK